MSKAIEVFGEVQTNLPWLGSVGDCWSEGPKSLCLPQVGL